MARKYLELTCMESMAQSEISHGGDGIGLGGDGGVHGGDGGGCEDGDDFLEDHGGGDEHESA